MRAETYGLKCQAHLQADLLQAWEWDLLPRLARSVLAVAARALALLGMRNEQSIQVIEVENNQTVLPTTHSPEDHDSFPRAPNYSFPPTRLKHPLLIPDTLRTPNFSFLPTRAEHQLLIPATRPELQLHNPTTRPEDKLLIAPDTNYSFPHPPNTNPRIPPEPPRTPTTYSFPPSHPDPPRTPTTHSPRPAPTPKTNYSLRIPPDPHRTPTTHCPDPPRTPTTPPPRPTPNTNYSIYSFPPTRPAPPTTHSPRPAPNSNYSFPVTAISLAGQRHADSLAPKYDQRSSGKSMPIIVKGNSFNARPRGVCLSRSQKPSA